jgi:septum site-determining protein MinD
MAGKTVVITSGKGGVGKTTTTANVGTALAMRGKKVVMIDTDIGLRNLDVVVGLENRIVYDLVQVVEGQCKVQQAMIRDRNVGDLYLIPAAQTRDKSAIRPEQLKDLCEQLKKDFDYVLIDSPAGIEQGFQTAIAPADQALLVTTPEVSAVRDADRVIGLIEAAGLPPANLVLNRIRSHMVKRGDMMSTEDILGLLSVKLIGTVPDDEDIVVSTNKGVPAARDPKSWSGRAFRNIAARLEGEEVPFLKMEPQEGLLARLTQFLGLKRKEYSRV